MGDSSSENELISELCGATTSPLSEAPTSIKRKKMFRWTATKDFMLVNEVALSKPFLESGSAASEMWGKIVDAVNSRFQDANVKEVAVKRRFQRLLEKFRKEDFRNRYKSGTEEEVTVIVDQLGEIASLIDDAKQIAEAEATKKSKKVEEEKVVAEEIRGAAVSTVKRKANDDDPVPVVKRLSEKSLSEMWNDKQEQDRLQQEKRMKTEEERYKQELEQRDKDREVRLKEIDLKEKELDLDRMKQEQIFKIQQEELKLKQQQFEVEKEERSSMVQSQKAMLDLLFKHLK